MFYFIYFYNIHVLKNYNNFLKWILNFIRYYFQTFHSVPAVSLSKIPVVFAVKLIIYVVGNSPREVQNPPPPPSSQQGRAGSHSGITDYVPDRPMQIRHWVFHLKIMKILQSFSVFRVLLMCALGDNVILVLSTFMVFFCNNIHYFFL